MVHNRQLGLSTATPAARRAPGSMLPLLPETAEERSEAEVKGILSEMMRLAATQPRDANEKKENSRACAPAHAAVPLRRAREKDARARTRAPVCVCVRACVIEYVCVCARAR
jgi:hypothetical protein